MNILKVAVYLQDHHAGSVGARELLRAAMEREESPDKEFCAALDREIAEDQKVLEDLITRAEAEESLPKKAAGWLAEKLSRLKMGGSGDPLPHLEFLESLLLGVRGKLALWEALNSLTEGHALREGLDLGDLIRRANDQLERIEERRVAAFGRMVRDGK